MRNHACAIWFTGPSGAGKTTLAGLVRNLLRHREEKVEVLDGDDVRETLCKDLGFSKADRDTNVRRIAWVSSLLTRNGVFVCAAAISPYEETRREIRATLGHLVLVHCTAPLEVLEARDVKGLYRRVRSGTLKSFTGIDAPYEVPPAPDVVVCSDGREAPNESARRIVATVERMGYLRGSVQR